MNAPWIEDVDMFDNQFLLMDVLATRLHPAVTHLDLYSRGEMHLSEEDIKRCHRIRDILSSALIGKSLNELLELVSLDDTDLRATSLQDNDVGCRHCADNDYWARMAVWSEEEGAALLLGLDPEWVLSSLAERAFLTSRGKRFSQIRDWAISAVKGRFFKEQITPAEFLAWADLQTIEVPEALRKAVEEKGVYTLGNTSLNDQKEDELQLLRKENKELSETLRKRDGSSQRLRIVNKLLAYVWREAKGTAKTELLSVPDRSVRLLIARELKVDERSVANALKKAFSAN